MFRKVNAIVIFVQDLQKCIAFYRDTLAFPVTFSDDVSMGFRVADQDFLVLQVAAAAEMVGKDALLPNSMAGSKVLLCVGFENVDTAYQELTAKGIAFLKPPVDQPWGRRTAYLADPEGNLWELYHELPN